LTILANFAAIHAVCGIDPSTILASLNFVASTPRLAVGAGRRGNTSNILADIARAVLGADIAKSKAERDIDPCTILASLNIVVST
jgi:hypothetical protein